MSPSFICHQCGKIFYKTDHVTTRPPKYCSQKCAGLSQRKQTFVCQYCGNTYTTSGRHAKEITKYCSKQCKNLAHKVIVACQVCKKEFLVSPSNAERRKYCSKRCQGIGMTPSPNKTCQNCGKPFYTKPSIKAKYCSKECADASKKNIRGKDHPAWNKIECVCQGCGKVFFVTQSAFKAGLGKHCSMECRKLPRIELICQLCGKPFYRLPCQVSPDNYGKFCSISCRQQFTCMTAYRRKPSSIEQILIDELDTRGIAYKFQYPFIGCVIDFAFPGHKLAVEADGKYWHNLKHIKAKDKRKNKMLKAQNWTIIRLGEDEIRQSPVACIDKIIQFLDTHTQLHLF